MKNILFIIHSMHIGGAEKVLLDFLDLLDYEKYNVDLLLYSDAGDLISSINKNVRLLVVHSVCSSLAKKSIRKLFQIFNLEDWYDTWILKKITKEHYDVTISFCQGLAHKIHTLILDKSKNNLSWIHSDLTISNWGISFFENSLQKQQDAYNLMDKLVFVSDQARKSFNTLFNIRESIEQYTIYNFINEKRIKGRSLEAVQTQRRKFTFINIGRLIEAKRQDRLIDTAKILRDKGYDFEIWILGDGPLRNDLEKRIKKNSVEQNVILLGLQSNPYPYLAIADCFVLTSQQEGFSVVIGEAFAFSKPVISTTITGPTEILDNNTYGLLVSQDVEKIASSMELMMNDEGLRMHYSKKGYERLSLFNPRKIIEQLYSIL